jgi:flagellin
MSLRINQNIAAFNAYRNLNVSDTQMSKSLEKLSSGFRINRAADDAAGLVISESLRAQVGGLKVAVRNAQDGISVVQTAEGALNEVHSMLQRMRDLAVQAANGSQDDDARAAADSEYQALATEIGRMADSTKFGGTPLLDGSFAGVAFQVGANSADTIDVDGYDLSSLDTTGDLTTASGASSAIDTIDSAIKDVSSGRGDLGALQNRFEHAIANLNVSIENVSASESRIRDVDMAQEMVQFTRSQILTQAGTAMLAQANSAPQGVLQLLRG